MPAKVQGTFEGNSHQENLSNGELKTVLLNIKNPYVTYKNRG